jgi:hypothetical protein
MTARLAGLAHALGHEYRFAPARELAGGAILGLLVGVIVALVLGAMR